MKNLKAIYDIGVPAGMEAEDAKYIGMSNLGTFFFLLLNIPFIFYTYFSGWPLVCFELILFEALLLLVFVFNKLGSHTIAIVWFGTLINIHLIITSVSLGWDVKVHYLIFFTAGGAVTLFRKEQSALMVAAVLGCISAYYIAFLLAMRVEPLYVLTMNEKEVLNRVFELTFCLLIVMNAFVWRYGALAAEERLKREQNKTRRLLGRVQDMDRQKTAFFQNISHEFRTPLTLIVGPMNQVLSGKLGAIGDRLKKQIEIVSWNARHLLRLINQLLDLSKLDAGGMKVRARKSNLVEFIRYFVGLFSSHAEKRKIDLTLHADAENLVVYLDPELLEKVVFNLLSNAFKFTPDNGRISVTITENTNAKTVEISIKDNGPGIAQDELSYIFDRFRQVDHATTWEHGGTGIGLSLVKEIVELHGGSVRVSSSEKTGTEFIVALPQGKRHLNEDEIVDEEFIISSTFKAASLEMDAVEQIDDGEMGERKSKADESAARILIVEDNPDMRRYIRGAIEGDYQVIEAENGERGLEKAQAMIPDLIISDVMMPGMDGYRLCRAVKSSPELSHIPVVLLTAMATDEMAVEGLKAGAYDYIIKPFSPDVLMAKLRGILHRQARQLEYRYTDNLTGLRKREAWEQEVNREINKMARVGGVSSLAFIDLDDFKVINDTYGHKAGDTVLVQFAATLVSYLRSSDLIGRYGGEEFVVYFPETPGGEAAESMERVLARFQSLAIGGMKLRCTFSAGVTEIGDRLNRALDEYVSQADAAMYEAKRRGKRCIVSWDGSIPTVLKEE